MAWKRILKWGTALLALVAVSILVACNPRPQDVQAPATDTFRVGTLNVHYIILGSEDGPWSEAGWHVRKGSMDAAFKAMNADIVAFQEMESFGRGTDKNINLARDWLLERNPDYAAAANGDANVFPSTQPIFYRTDRVTLRDQGWFFFSETPDVIYARTFNGSFPAFASWAEFMIDGERLRVVNIHNDFASRSNRILSSELIADRIRPWLATGERVMVVGDFNAMRSGAPVQIVADEGINFAAVRGATFHLNSGVGLFGAIDHLGVSDGLRLVGETQVLRGRFDGEYPTDHYPVVGDFAFN